MPRLVALFGPRRGVTREFDRTLLVGRGEHADLLLIDSKVSREHCAIEPDGEGWQVRDFGSRNGTWLNAKRLEKPTHLTPGDQLALGQSVLLFEPSLEALLSKDGGVTAVLHRDALAPAAAIAESVAAVVPAALLEEVLAASTPLEAAQGVARHAVETFSARAAVVLQGHALPLAGWPEGAQVPLPEGLLREAAQRKRSVGGPQQLSDAESDEATTRVRASPGHVAVAPLLRGGEAVGALAVVRQGAFSAAELGQLSGLALAATAGLAPATAMRAAAPRAGPVAQSAVMKALLQTVQTVARAPTTVLFTGETGTGKEELARHLHASSPRAKGPFVAVNCGAIPAELAESELFGHEKGAFTGAHALQVGLFERADGGTLFLDEVGELPLPLQVKLLRVLQERCVQRVGGGRLLPVDVRLVAATHRPLEALVEKGLFREDLFWRLNVVRLQVPPLRDRPDDVLPLAQHLLQRLGASLGRAAPTLAKGAEVVLTRSSWPGNVRQLANALERALVLQAVPGPITADELSQPGAVESASSAQAASGTLAQRLAVVERDAIVRALKAARGVKSSAAEALDISRPTLDRKLAEYEIDLFKGDGAS